MHMRAHLSCGQGGRYIGANYSSNIVDGQVAKDDWYRQLGDLYQ